MPPKKTSKRSKSSATPKHKPAASELTAKPVRPRRAPDPSSEIAAKPRRAPQPTTPEPPRAPARRSAGGGATTSGTTFQEDVAAFLCVLILAENLAPNVFDLAPGVTLEKISAETQDSIDDLELHASDRGRVLLQCKTSIALSDKPDSTFGKVMHELVNQASPSILDANKGILTLLSPQDRCVLAVGRDAAAPLAEHLHKALNVIRNAHTLPDAQEYIQRQSQDVRHAYAVLMAQIERARKDRTRPVEPLSLLRLTHVTRFDFSPGGPHTALADFILRNAVLEPGQDPGQAWHALVAIARSLSPKRSGASRAALQDFLARRGIKLRDAADPTDAEFERTYRAQLAARLDKLRLYGLEDAFPDIDDASLEYPLTRAFVLPIVSPPDSPGTSYSLVDLATSAWNTSTPTRLLLVGEAGAGKTTLVSWLAVVLAHGAVPSDDREITRALPGLAKLPYDARPGDHFPSDLVPWLRRIPFVIRLRDHFARGADLASLNPADALRRFTDKAPRPEWLRKVLADRALLAFDGIDEVPLEDRDRVVDRILQILRDLPSCACLVTTRQSGVIPWKDRLVAEGAFQPWNIADLAPHQITEFNARWHDAMEQKLRERFTPGPDRDEALKQLDERRRSIGPSLAARPQVRSLCSVPVLAAMVCAVHRKTGRLPDSERDLVERMCRLLLFSRDRTQVQSKDLPPRSPQWEQFTYDDRRKLAREVAFEMMSAGASSELYAPPRFPRENAPDEDLPPICRIVREQAVRRFGPGHAAAEAIYTDFISRGGIVETPQRETLSFVHNTFKEFLAAEQYVKLRHLEQLAREIGNGAFENVIAFAAAHPDEGGDYVVPGAKPRRETTFVAELIRRVLGAYDKSRKSGSDDTLDPETARLRRLLVRMKRAQSSHDPDNRARLELIERDMLSAPTDEDVRFFVESGDAFVPAMAWSDQASPHAREIWARSLGRIGSPLAMATLEPYRDHPDAPLEALAEFFEPFTIRSARVIAYSNRNLPLAVTSRIRDIRPLLELRDDEKPHWSKWSRVPNLHRLEDIQLLPLAEFTPPQPMLSLSLRGTHLTDQGLAALLRTDSWLRRLSSLGLAYTKIAGDALNILGDPQTGPRDLTFLDISYTAVPNDALQRLADSPKALPNLKSLGMLDHDVSEKTLAALRRRIATVTVSQ